MIDSLIEPISLEYILTVFTLKLLLFLCLFFYENFLNECINSNRELVAHYIYINVPIRFRHAKLIEQERAHKRNVIRMFKLFVFFLFRYFTKLV